MLINASLQTFTLYKNQNLIEEKEETTSLWRQQLKKKIAAIYTCTLYEINYNCKFVPVILMILTDYQQSDPIGIPFIPLTYGTLKRENKATSARADGHYVNARLNLIDDSGSPSPPPAPEIPSFCNLIL